MDEDMKGVRGDECNTQNIRIKSLNHSSLACTRFQGLDPSIIPDRQDTTRRSKINNIELMQVLPEFSPQTMFKNQFLSRQAISLIWITTMLF
eukprot:1160858-Pelagomonas_calceolata.AAC.10